MKIILILLGIIIIITTITIIEEKIFHKEEEYDEETEQDKLYKALRILIYVIIGVIIITAFIKLSIFSRLLSLI